MASSNKLSQKKQQALQLTWSHILHLLSLEEDDGVRFQEQCLAEEWSSKELHRRIKEYRDPAGQGGRRFQKPKSTESALRQLIRKSQMWHRRYEEVWFESDAPAIEIEDRKRLSTETLELVDEAIETLNVVREDIDQSLEFLDAARKAKKKPVRKRL